MRSNWVFVSWIAHHTRSENLARALGMPAFFLAGGAGRYLVNSVATWRELRRRRPTGVVVMQPPPVVLVVCRIYAALHGTVVIGDLHTGTFTDPKWRWSTRTVLQLLRGRHGAIVTNEALRGVCEANGVQAVVADDPIPDIPAANRLPIEASLQRTDGPFVIVPLAYAHDEPIDAILDAAKALPDVPFVLTGRAPAEIAKRAPANVQLPGYLTVAEYRRRLACAGLVLALTTEENTMQCAGYEALTYGVPLLTSPTKVLRDYFGDAAVYTSPDGASIAREVRAALSDGPNRRRQMASHRKTIVARQEQQQAALRAFISRRESPRVPA